MRAMRDHDHQGVYDFRPCDKIVDWAIDRGMEVKGHTLCWHVTTPEFAEDMSASRLREALYRQEREGEKTGRQKHEIVGDMRARQTDRQKHEVVGDMRREKTIIYTRETWTGRHRDSFGERARAS